MASLLNAQAKAGSLVAAALETAGIERQAEMLQLVNGEQGQMLAGLLFLIAIIAAVITLAIGGNYKWGRYLLVGPPLFFFLTQVTTQSQGTIWQFGKDKFPEELREQALRTVRESASTTGQTGGKEVALFFEFWNIFMSTITQELVSLLNLEGDKSHLSFMTKVERYMSFWDQNYINDPHIRALIHMVMSTECADYYMMLKIQADPHVSDVQKAFYADELRERAAVAVSAEHMLSSKEENETLYWLAERGFEAYEPRTCDELWKGVVQLLRPVIRENIIIELQAKRDPNQTGGSIIRTFFRKLQTETSRATSMTRFTEDDASLNGLSDEEIADKLMNDPAFEGGLLNAVDWVIARSLFHEIWDQSKYTDYFTFERATGNRATGMGRENMLTDQISTTASAIQQFNRTETYQFKGDYVNAALSLPHFQGTLLLLLATTYPFFAMLVVMPGRASAILTWMGLWAWVKLWDVGMAVVMMIDNILYALFPRAPNLMPGEIDDAGKAWVRIMEVDPNYSSATYYNLIATCMFAVPLVTAVFVKAGGSELVNLMHGSWNSYATRLSGGAVTIAHSLQAQSYASRFQKEKLARVEAAEAHAKTTGEYKAIESEYKQLAALQGALKAGDWAKEVDGAIKSHGLTYLSGVADKGQKVAAAVIDARMEMLANQQKAYLGLAGKQAAYDYSISSSAYWASESAVAARYFTHDFANEYPHKAMMNMWYSTRAFNSEGIYNAIGDGLKELGLGGAPKAPEEKK